MREFIKKYRYDIVIGGTITLFALSAFFIEDRFSFLSSREEFRELVMSFGIWAPAAVILLISLEVIIAPIPGFVPAVTAGFIFGPVMGGLYVYLGNIIGSLAVFFLARRIGRTIAVSLFREERIKKYEKAIARHENLLLVFYFFPVFPLDVITAAFGLSAISRKKFVSAVAFGYLAYAFVLAIFGDYLAKLFF